MHSLRAPAPNPTIRGTVLQEVYAEVAPQSHLRPSTCADTRSHRSRRRGSLLAHVLSFGCLSSLCDRVRGDPGGPDALPLLYSFGTCPAVAALRLRPARRRTVPGGSYLTANSDRGRPQLFTGVDNPSPAALARRPRETALGLRAMNIGDSTREDCLVALGLT